MNAFPVPGTGAVEVLVPAPSPGEGHWVGAPSAALDVDGSIVLAYRVRMVDTRGAATVVTRLADDGRPTTVATLDKDRFGAESLERPALVRTPAGRWRLYVCCATPGSKHWWIDVLEADDPAGLAGAEARTVFPGDPATVGVKDPVIRVVGGTTAGGLSPREATTAGGLSPREATTAVGLSPREATWHAWICCHPLDVAGAEDRMTTAYATSPDGLDWTWHGTVLAGRPGTWDARGARVTAVLPDGRAAYDGRASAEENFSERTGLAVPAGGGLRAQDHAPVAAVRYLDVLPLPDGGYRLFYEAPLPDGSHELRTELVAS